MSEELPDGFPPLTLPIMRALCALTILHPGKEGQKRLVSCLDVLYHAYWVENKKTIDKDVLSAELTRVLGAEDAAKGKFLIFVSCETVQYRILRRD